MDQIGVNAESLSECASQIQKQAGKLNEIAQKTACAAQGLTTDASVFDTHAVHLLRQSRQLMEQADQMSRLAQVLYNASEMYRACEQKNASQFVRPASTCGDIFADQLNMEKWRKFLVSKIILVPERMRILLKTETLERAYSSLIAPLMDTEE